MQEEESAEKKKTKGDYYCFAGYTHVVYSWSKFVSFFREEINKIFNLLNKI